MARRPRTPFKHRFWRLLLVPVPFVLALPFLVRPSFSLVDDGVTLDVARRMDTNDMRPDEATGKPHSPYWYIERDVGRVRPAYWWWLWFNYRLYGTRSGGWQFGLALSLAVLLQLVYGISYRVTGSVLAGMLAGGLVAAFHPYAAIFSRLGLAETPMLLLIGMSVLCVVHAYNLGPRVPKKKEALFFLCCVGAIVPLGVAYFVKETCLAMLPASLVMLAALWRRKADWHSKALLIGYAVANVAFAVALLAYVVPVLGTGSYARLYLFQHSGWDLATKLGTGFEFFYGYLATLGKGWSALPLLALAVLGVRLVVARRSAAAPAESEARGAKERGAKQRNKRAKGGAEHSGGSPGLTEAMRWQLVWLTMAVVSVVLLAPWGGSDEAVARYLFPCMMFAALLIAQEMAWLLTSARRGLVELNRSPGRYELQRVTLRAVVVSVIALLCVLGAVNVVLAVGSTVKAHRRQAADANLVRLLAAEAPQGQPLYANLVVAHEEETRYEIRLHLWMIYGRADFRNDHSVYYVGDPERPGIPEVFRSYVGLPKQGQWVLVPSGERYRRDTSREIAAMHAALRPTKTYAVTANGAEQVPDAQKLLEKLQQAKYGWAVFERGPLVERPASSEGET